MVWRTPARAVQTARHQLWIAISRSGPAGADSTSATVMLPRSSGKYTRGQSLFRRPSFMRFLNLAARKTAFPREIKANQSEHNADRPAVVVCGLHGERVHHVLQDKSGWAHRVDLHLVVPGMHGIHIVPHMVGK
jgi:hypothetical protein